MPPIEPPPVRPVAVFLVKNVVQAIFKNQPVRFVHPIGGRDSVKDWSVRVVHKTAFRHGQIGRSSGRFRGDQGGYLALR